MRYHLARLFDMLKQETSRKDFFNEKDHCSAQKNTIVLMLIVKSKHEMLLIYLR